MSAPVNTPLTLASLAEKLGAEFRGDGELLISGLAPIQSAGPNQLVFVTGKKYLSTLTGSKAGAVLVRPEDADACSMATILVDNPYLAYALASQILYPAPVVQAGIHPSAVVDTAANISADAEIGPCVVIEAGVTVEAQVVIGAGSFLGAGCHIGAGTRLAANTTVYHGCSLGENCRVLSGSVIGADGFGFAPERGVGWHRIEQIGAVRIGNRVEIGACTTVDRGALGDTVIEDGVIIDNHVQIAHNVHIGKYTAIAGCAGIAGSARIGSMCQIGGGSSITGHLEIADGVVVFANTFVASSLTAGVYASATVAQPVADWRRNQRGLRQFHLLARHARKLIEKVRGDDSPVAQRSE